MYTFTISLLLLIAGYFVYGSFVERVFRPQSEQPTPCYRLQDGADYTPMSTWKVYTIQFLNIAGTGPIFGALLGILYGPAAYLWIVLGCIFGGAMHDYMSGMISLRKEGASLPEIIGDELGTVCRLVMRVVTLLLMVCVGASFVMVPADLLVQLTGLEGSNIYWVVMIFAFYLLVAVGSVNKIIGNVYPVFGVALLVMALMVGVSIYTQSGALPEITEAFADHNPVAGHTPLFPGMFVSIACGAVSGFHATQSPMMARCIKQERYGLRCFYGAMITEGVMTLVWAAAAIKFADSIDVSLYPSLTADSTPYDKLVALLTNGGQSGVSPSTFVNLLCEKWLGKVGLVLAILGIVAAPMSTGGTAFRGARLIIADFMHYGQQTLLRRIIVVTPVFVAAILMLAMKFDVLWRYVSWFNQVLSAFTFFAIAYWLRDRSCRDGIRSWSWLISFFPALFMTAVSSSFILIAPEGFRLPLVVGYAISATVTLAVAALFLWHAYRKPEA
ncbi:MAG: carbon starvation protein A [Bacteroidaceae bacterium]|nr:carbon starvation protein A [Bacteroidaceae bacterium]